ncbi:MAG: sulfatase-like hydrolase/transferase, partial [Acidimicrobiia bacterium]
TLSYAHLEAPHVPWVTNPSGTHYSRPEDYTEVEGVEGQGFWVLEPEPVLLGYQRHLYQLGFVDRMIGRILDQLDETGQWDDTMIVVLADHGASFVPGQHRRWPYDDNRDDLYRIPLFVKYPNQTGGRVVDDPAFGIDVLPTIVDALGVETDWEFDGISLLDAEGNDRPHQPIFWCCNGDGVSTDLDILFDQVERNHTWIPDQTSWTGIAGVGPNADLVGKTVDELDVTEVDDFVWSLDKGSDLVETDINSGMVQTLLTGRIELPADSGDDIIVILNGRVAGVGYVQRDGPGSGSLRALVAEEMILDGHNDIEILLAGGVARNWLSGTSDLLTLEYATADGRVLDVRAEGSRRIQIDPATMTADGWTIEGWAADITRKETPHTVYLFVGDRLIGSGPPNVENADVVRWFSSDDLLESGFRFDVSRSEIPVDVERLTVIAEFDAYAVSDQLSLTR